MQLHTADKRSVNRSSSTCAGSREVLCWNRVSTARRKQQQLFCHTREQLACPEFHHMLQTQGKAFGTSMAHASNQARCQLMDKGDRE